MRHLKFISLLVCLVLFLSITPAFAAPADGFPDLKGHWAEAALTRAVQNGLLNGDGGKLLPDDTLTRAQLAAIVTRAFKAPKGADISHFNDTAPGDWHYDSIAKAVAMGVLKGDGGGTVRPDDSITREEVFAVLARLLILDDGGSSYLSGFQDAALVSSWARGTAAAVVREKLVTGDGGRLKPLDAITRAEFAVILDRIVSAYAYETPVTAFEGTSLVVAVPDAVLKGLTIPGDLYIADGVGGTVVTLDGVTVEGRIVVRAGSTIILKNGSTVRGGAVILPGLAPKFEIEDGSSIAGMTPGTETPGTPPDEGGGSGPIIGHKPTIRSYTFDEVLEGFDLNERQQLVHRYVEFLTDPTFDPSNNLTDVELLNAATFVDGAFDLSPSLFPSLRGVSSSCLTEDRAGLWLGYTEGGVDYVSLSTKKVSTFAHEALDGKPVLLLVGQENSTVYVITADSVVSITR